MPVSNTDISQLSCSQLHTSADDASLITVPIVRSLALEPFPAAFKAPSLRTEPQGYLQAVLQKSRLGCNWSVNYCTLQQTVPPKTEAAYWKINNRSACVCGRKKKKRQVCGRSSEPSTRAAASSQIQSPYKITCLITKALELWEVRCMTLHKLHTGNFLVGAPFPLGLASRSAPVWRNPSLRLYLCGEICAKPK